MAMLLPPLYAFQLGLSGYALRLSSQIARQTLHSNPKEATGKVADASSRNEEQARLPVRRSSIRQLCKTLIIEPSQILVSFLTAAAPFVIAGTTVALGGTEPSWAYAVKITIQSINIVNTINARRALRVPEQSKSGSDLGKLKTQLGYMAGVWALSFTLPLLFEVYKLVT